MGRQRGALKIVGGTNMSSPNATWLRGPRVRVDTLKPGDHFVALTGVVYKYEKTDEDDCRIHHVACAEGEFTTTFPGAAQVVVIDPGASP